MPGGNFVDMDDAKKDETLVEKMLTFIIDSVGVLTLVIIIGFLIYFFYYVINLLLHPNQMKEMFKSKPMPKEIRGKWWAYLIPWIPFIVFFSLPR
jgi:hypothetical protein